MIAHGRPPDGDQLVHRATVPAREADWDALYADQLPRIYNYFRFRVGHGAVAEDLTSATFEKAWRVWQAADKLGLHR